MKLLRNFDSHDLFFDMESETGFESLDVGKIIVGWYKLVGNCLSALYVQNFDPYFLSGAERFQIKNDYKVVLQKKSGNKIDLFILDCV